MAARPRNILLIISDDLGVDASMCYGKDNEVANTPNLKALCDRGVALTMPGRTLFVHPHGRPCLPAGIASAPGRCPSR